MIIMVSDGCGYNHIAATDYYQCGKLGKQVYEEFPIQYGMSTYSHYSGYDPTLAWTDFGHVKLGYTDSASAATAMSTGYKTYDSAIGVDIYGQPLTHLMEVAEDQGNATGAVTSVEWSHATPAGFVAHNVNHNNYEHIASEMIWGSAADVIVGCGHPWFGANGEPRGTHNTYKYVGGVGTWDALAAGTAASDADGDGDMDPWTLVQTRKEFQKLAKGNTPDRVCGVAEVYQTLQQGRAGDGSADPFAVPLIDSVPTLAEMTEAALNVLDNDLDGLVLMVEGGAIDWASHANQSGRMIEEEIDFNAAVEAVVHWVDRISSWQETLVIVTGDHECGYLTGPSSDPTWEAIVGNGEGVLSGMEWHSASHTNALIPVFAKGAGSDLLSGYADEADPVHGFYVDNTEIAELIMSLLN